MCVDRTALEAAIASLQVRDPLKSMMNPRFELGLLHADGGDLLISIDTFYAEDGKPMKDWKNPFPFSAYMAGRFLRDPVKLASFAIEALLSFLKHEAEESILLNGKLAITPLHNNAGPIPV